MPCAGGAQAAGSAWGAGGGQSGGLAFHASPAASALLLERVTLNLQASLPVSNEVWLNPGLLVSRMEIDHSSNNRFALRTTTLSVKEDSCRIEPNTLIKYLQT